MLYPAELLALEGKSAREVAANDLDRPNYRPNFGNVTITVAPEKRHDGVRRFRLTVYLRRDHWRQAKRYRAGFASATAAEERRRELTRLLRSGGMEAVCDEVWGVERQEATHDAKSMHRVKDVVAEFIAMKERAGRRPSTVSNLKFRLGVLAREFGTLPIGAVTSAKLQTHLDGMKSSARDRINHAIVWRNFFAWCVRRGKRRENPMASVELPKARRGLPAVAPPWRVARLVAAAWYGYGDKRYPGETLGYALLVFFSPIRPEEALKLGWERVNFEQSLAALDEHVTKISRIRHARLSPDLLRCLAALKRLGYAPATCNRRGWRRVLRRSGMREAWAIDVGRHTYASSVYALTNDEVSLSADMGNSVTVLRRNYVNRLVTREQAAAWQRILSRVAAKLEAISG